MSKIILLNDYVANKIAAGEVIERPASIVKELVENSIDAGSTKIEINIKEGGIELIKVKDNGEGIEKEDIEKAFLRHATSKIRDDKDLFKIKTLGFRGEALPSIAVISHTTLLTSTDNTGKGTEIYLEGGKINYIKETAHTKGTEIIVKDIFFNTPVRLKYVKTIQTELGHIIDYVNRLSLAYPNIAFSLFHNERLLLKTYGNNNLIHVISAIYGSDVAKKMISVNFENIDLKITGAISKPEITRTNKNHITFLINNRYIKNYSLTNAIINGYKDLLMINKFPIAILNIEMDPVLFDVNVHPAKLEVRFSKEKEMNKFLEDNIYNRLISHKLIPEPVKNKTDKNIYCFQPTIDLKLNNNDIELSDFRIERESDFYQTSDDLLKKDIFIKEDYKENSDNYSSNNKLPFLEPIAQIHGTYIIAQDTDGVYLIDQHAAHERINYERNLKLINQKKIDNQELLIPITLDYSHSEIDVIFNKFESLKKVGIEIELFGEKTIIVRSVPVWIPKGEGIHFIEKTLQTILFGNEIDLIEINKELTASESCKASIKANSYLSKKEMENILEKLRATENPFSCPHGRPILVYISKYDIEKMFKRVTP